MNKKFGDNVTLVQGILSEIVDTQKIKIKRTEGLDNGDQLANAQDEIISYDYLSKRLNIKCLSSILFKYLVNSHDIISNFY